MTRILVTGGAGFIGHHLVARLVADGHDVVVLDNLHRATFERPELTGATLICGDIRDPDCCRSAVNSCEVVVHLAAQSKVMDSVNDPRYAFTTNVDGTWEVALASAAAGVKRLVFASSREVYGDQEVLPVGEERTLSPKNLYGATKVAAEAILAGLPSCSPSVSILRFTNVVGSGDSERVLPLWLERAREHAPLTLFGGRQLIDFVPVSTAVEAIRAAIDLAEPVSPINVGSGVGTTLTQLAERVVRATNSRSLIQVAPARGPEVERFTADVERMQRILGVSPPRDPLVDIARIADLPA